jgi:hypothetical protein
MGRLFRDRGGDGLVGEGRQEDAVGGFKPRLVDVERMLEWVEPWSALSPMISGSSESTSLPVVVAAAAKCAIAD